MKREFWQDPTTTLILFPILFLIVFSMEILGIVLYAIDPENLIVFIGATFMLLLGIAAFFFDKERFYTTKITFFDDKIVLKRFNKEVNSIMWSDIIKVEGRYYFYASVYMVFITEDTEIKVFPTKKMYQTIVSVCPYENLRTMINNLEMFKWYHRNDSKNNQK